MSTEDPLNDYEQNIIANVREHGCHINVVADPDGDAPAFAYSIGFQQSVHQPEVIIFGLPFDIMTFMINETLHQCRAGLQLGDWTRVDDLLIGHSCIARAVDPRYVVTDYLNSAIWFHERTAGKGLPDVVQLVWPGAEDGVFPWEDGCSESVRKNQPALYEQRQAA